jgi:MFS family permease
MSASDATVKEVRSLVPARMDRLPWSRFHWMIVVGLGFSWILDGLEVQIVAANGYAATLGMGPAEVGLAGTCYLLGQVFGALVFGRLADRLGRKRLFLLTLAVYMAATIATAFTVDFWTFVACRFVTGFGIGGEYAAINSAIDELIPARVRGRVNLAINGSFWIGAALGAVLSLVLLDERVLGPALGWRAGFLAGGTLAVAILLVRRYVPESPRWLIAHGRIAEAEAIVSAIEDSVRARRGAPLDELPAESALPVGRRRLPTMREVAHVLLRRYPERSAVVLALMVSQAFFYNAIFFTYALVLTRFYGVAAGEVALYIFPFAAGNVLGPLLLGPLFDRVGRRVMIAATYALSGVGLALTGVGFLFDVLDATTHTLAWSGVFFLASAAASSAYLTASEVFPLEMRALSISVFYAVGTGVGGFAAPALFGALIATGSRGNVFIGYAVGAAMVLAAAVIAWRYAVDAERRPLEQVAAPLGEEEGGDRHR